MIDPGEKPKHKPSQKHTLDEVLRSLQDMIRHELVDIPAKKTAGTDTTPRAHDADIHADLEKALETLKSDLEDSLLRTSGPIPFESLNSLLPVLGAPADASPRTAPGPAAHGTGAAVLMDPPPYTARKELPALHPDHAPAEARAPTAPARVNQRDLPFLDGVTPTGSTPTPMREHAPSSTRPGLAGVATQTDDTYQPQTTRDSLVSAALSNAEAIAREEALLADSIPLLTDAVVFPEAAGEADAEEAVQLEAPLPTPDRARDIAIRVAARLNIELRKSGRRGLNTPAIIRLAQLLRDALAQAQSNMDNSDRDLDR
jgi:hypothetical protein